MAQECHDPWSNTRVKNSLEADLVISAVQECIREAEKETALRTAYELYITSTFHEKKMWNRLLVISIRDVGLGGTQVPIFVKTMYNFHKEYPYMDGDRPIFSARTIRYTCRCQKERSIDHIENITMKEFKAGYVPEVPEYVIDIRTIKGRAMGRDAFCFLDETNKIQPLWDGYDDSYRLKLYEMYRKEAEQKKGDK